MSLQLLHVPPSKTQLTFNPRVDKTNGTVEKERNYLLIELEMFNAEPLQKTCSVSVSP